MTALCTFGSINYIISDRHPNNLTRAAGRVWTCIFRRLLRLVTFQQRILHLQEKTMTVHGSSVWYQQNDRLGYQ